MGCAESSPANIPLKEDDFNAKEAKEVLEDKEQSHNPVHLLKNEKNYKLKRENVFTEGLELSLENNKNNKNKSIYDIRIFEKTEEQKQFILKSLEHNFIFSSLGENEKNLLVGAMNPFEVGPNFNVITQGEEGDFFYLVEKGVFTVIVNGDAVASLSDGKTFGELALLYNTPRQATIRAQGSARLFSLDRTTFRYILAKNSFDKIQTIQEALSKVTLLADLTPNQLHKISQAVEIIKYEAGKTIIEKGSEGNTFYMIQEGTVRVSDVGSAGSYNDHTLSSGSYFGERALITGEPRAANITAITPTILMALDRESFTSLLGPLREVLDYNLNMRVLENIKLFANLTKSEKSNISRSFDYETFMEGTVIIREGEKGKKFYILKEGTANVTCNGELITTLTNGQYFGEMALLDDEVRKATVTAATDCECFVIDRLKFNKFIRVGSLQVALTRETEQRKLELQTKLNTSQNNSNNDENNSTNNNNNNDNNNKLKLNDLNKMILLGAGTFGRVFLVQPKTEVITTEGTKIDTNSVYALKVMSKTHIIQTKQVKNIINEKKIMFKFNNFPFLLKLYETFHDRDHLYMLLEFLQGGELFNIIHTTKSDGISLNQTLFYSAGVFLGLQHLHNENIGYRDMKPENCLIDNRGYPKLVDFGFAKVIENTMKSYTLCGTPEYLAPEIVLGRGHDKSVDYWAFGILLYEMLAGYTPFADHQNMDQMVICRNIVNGKLMFPRGFDANAKDLIKKLLIRDPIGRLGNLRGGTDDIKSHAFYSTFDFENFLNGILIAPWTPVVKSLTDTSNFDPLDDDFEDIPCDEETVWDREY